MSGVGSQLAVAAAGHVVQFYGTDEELAASVSGYLAAGLTAGESALVVATAAHRQLFMSRLAASGIDVTAAEAAGRLLAADAADTMDGFVTGDGIDPRLFESAVGGLIGPPAAAAQPVRIYAEMVALLWDAGQVSLALELEGLWNQLSARLPFSLRCGYPARLLVEEETAQAVDGVCRLHAAVIGPRPAAAGKDQLVADPRPGYAMVNGAPVVIPPAEVGLVNSQDVQDMLVRVLADHGTVIVDMRTNEHCDSSGISALLSAANRARAAGGDLLIVLTQPATRRIFKLTGVDRVLRIFETLDSAMSALAADSAPAGG